MKLNAIIGIIIFSVFIFALSIAVYLEIESKASSIYSIIPPTVIMISGCLFLVAVNYFSKRRKTI